MLRSDGTGSNAFAPQVLRAIDKEPEESCAALIECLAWIAPDVPTTKAVVERHLRSRSSSVREAAVTGAGWLEVPKQDLENDVADIALHDPDEFVRRGAIVALGGFATLSTRAVEVVCRHLDDNDDSLVCAAMGSLGRLRAAGRPALPKLTKLLRTATYGSTRECAAEAIGAIGSAPPETQGELVHSLTDDEPSVREAAATALGLLGNATEGTMPALKHSMRDPKPAVAVAAALAAWRIDHDAASAIPVLIALMDVRGKDEGAISCSLDALAAMGPAAHRVSRGRSMPDTRVRTGENIGVVDSSVSRASRRLLATLSVA